MNGHNNYVLTHKSMYGRWGGGKISVHRGGGKNVAIIEGGARLKFERFLEFHSPPPAVNNDHSLICATDHIETILGRFGPWRVSHAGKCYRPHSHLICIHVYTKNEEFLQSVIWYFQSQILKIHGILGCFLVPHIKIRQHDKGFLCHAMVALNRHLKKKLIPHFFSCCLDNKKIIFLLSGPWNNYFFQTKTWKWFVCCPDKKKRHVELIFFFSNDGFKPPYIITSISLSCFYRLV